MAGNFDQATAAAPKLQLDSETGEWVSKSELKKRNQKRARKSAKTAKSRDSTTNIEQSTAGKVAGANPVRDPDAIFKQGFLGDVYKENAVEEVVTRFPPEPNGYLHLGHVKAMMINFGFARYHGGRTNLRFDDTNPSTEDEIYADSILDTVRWLGFKPDKVTYTSDNFGKLYELAQKLIGLGKAYVCHCSEADIKLQRGGDKGGPRFRCSHSDQDVQANLDKFKEMHDGKYDPQTAFLRMKQDLESGNPMMWDIAAYRVPKLDSGREHARAPGWKIFPTYDFAHCLCDSLEGITHSLCTTEFTLSRESYEWLNRTLGVYEPMQREFGRLKLAGTVMSKRALRTLVEEGVVRGWDDPRLYTVIGLRRRGIPPEALLRFVQELGVSTAQTAIPISRFEQTVREHLETSVPRLMMALDPLPVEILDIEETLELDVPYMPKDRTWGSHTVSLPRRICIDRTDFREQASDGFFGLTPSQPVGLLNAPYPICVEDAVYKDGEGCETKRLLGLRAKWSAGSKPKSYIHWVPGKGSVPAEVRIYDRLFKSDEPMRSEGGFFNDVDPDSERVYPNALVERGIGELWPQIQRGAVPEDARFQALRVGYFSVDSDSSRGKVVVNRIVPLKASIGKG